MSGLNMWVMSLCVCAVAVAIVENLLPEGNVKKTVYFVLGLIVMTCFAVPVKDFEAITLDLKSESEITQENTDWLNRMTEDIFRSNVEELIENSLSDMDITAKKIEIHTDINEENSIFIDKVRITVAEEYSDRIDEIIDTLYKTLGLDTDVIVR